MLTPRAFYNLLISRHSLTALKDRQKTPNNFLHKHRCNKQFESESSRNKYKIFPAGSSTDPLETTPPYCRRCHDFFVLIRPTDSSTPGLNSTGYIHIKRGQWFLHLVKYMNVNVFEPRFYSYKTAPLTVVKSPIALT